MKYLSLKTRQSFSKVKKETKPVSSTLLAALQISRHVRKCMVNNEIEYEQTLFFRNTVFCNTLKFCFPFCLAVVFSCVPILFCYI